jgi:hypothetical protein
MTTEYLNNKLFESLIVRFQHAKKERVKFQMFMEDIKATEQRTIKRGKYQKPEGWFSTEKSFEIVLSDFHTVQNELATTFYKLSENIVRYAKFNLIDQDDAVQEGVMICFEKIDRFDPKKGKAFNYMTTCILNHFRQLYRTARNYNELKRKYLDFISIQLNQNLNKQNKKGVYNKHMQAD